MGLSQALGCACQERSASCPQGPQWGRAFGGMWSGWCGQRSRTAVCPGSGGFVGRAGCRQEGDDSGQEGRAWLVFLGVWTLSRGQWGAGKGFNLLGRGRQGSALHWVAASDRAFLGWCWPRAAVAWLAGGLGVSGAGGGVSWGSFSGRRPEEPRANSVARSHPAGRRDSPSWQPSITAPPPGGCRAHIYNI